MPSPEPQFKWEEKTQGGYPAPHPPAMSLCWSPYSDLQSPAMAGESTWVVHWECDYDLEGGLGLTTASTLAYGVDTCSS